MPYMSDKFPDGIHIATLEVNDLLCDGHRARAIQAAQKWLREGCGHQSFLNLVADLLEPIERKRGRPESETYQWVEIGQRFEELSTEGIIGKQAMELVMEQFHISEAVAKRCRAKYNKAIKDNAELE